MKSSHELTKEILDIEQKISTLNEQITNLQVKMEKARDDHARVIEQSLKSKKLEVGSPGDLWEQYVGAGLQADALEVAKTKLEARLNQAQSELGVVRLYESTIQAFKKEESDFIDNVKRIEKSISALNKNLDALAETIDIFMQEAGNPLDAVESLLKNPLLAGLSLQAFLVGEIRQATPNENDDFIATIGRKYLQLANGLPRLRNIEDSWMLLSNRLDALARQAQGLIPHRLKYHHAPQPRPRTEIETGSTIRIPIKPPPKKLNWGEKKAKELRRAAALFR
jgi:archaellum component FlaC